MAVKMQWAGDGTGRVYDMGGSGWKTGWGSGNNSEKTIHSGEQTL